MMLICDKLLGAPKLSGEEGLVLERARDLLRKAKLNHSSVDAPQGHVDRVIFGADACAVIAPLFESREELVAAVDGTAFPNHPLWIESDNLGWLSSYEGGDRHFTLFCADGRYVFPMGYISESEVKRRDVRRWHYFELTGRLIEKNIFTPDEVGNGAIAVIYYLAAISSPRVTTLRRVERGVGDRAARALARRRFQEGRPLYSFNQVEMVLPKTALHRGVLREVTDHPGVRRHLVIGHWRLIDGVLDPFWVWVDGHYRGDGARGEIVKERHVRFGRDTRRGFLMPEAPGIPGERQKAVRS